MYTLVRAKLCMCAPSGPTTDNYNAPKIAPVSSYPLTLVLSTCHHATLPSPRLRRRRSSRRQHLQRARAALRREAQLGVVEGLEGRAVPHAHVGQVRELLQRRVHRGLVGHVQRARGLVQDGQLRAVVEQPREGQALLLAEAQDLAPLAHRVQPAVRLVLRRRRLLPGGRLGLEPLDEALELHDLQDAADLVVHGLDLRGRMPRRLECRGVDDLLPERPRRAVRPLGQEERPARPRRRPADDALARRPKPRDGPEEAGLARPALANHEQRHRSDDASHVGQVQVEALDQLAAAVGRLQREALDL
mmetsp:Transcript_23539/g.73856  ORF Transcript_23539/g.73856 Transcript_23539/m.73856 type:complete len:304 (-) Transcript_23539:1611-2522(-)